MSSARHSLVIRAPTAGAGLQRWRFLNRLESADADASDTLDDIDEVDVQEQFLHAARRGDLSEDEVVTELDAYDRLATADADAILTEGGTAGVDVLRKLDQVSDAGLEDAAGVTRS